MAPILEWVEKAFGIPDARKVLNPAGLQAMQMLNAQALQASSAPQEAAEPRMAQDVKPAQPTQTPASQTAQKGPEAKVMKP